MLQQVQQGLSTFRKQLVSIFQTTKAKVQSLGGENEEQI